jgi:hypothetical protein
MVFGVKRFREKQKAKKSENRLGVERGPNANAKENAHDH